MSDPRAPSRYRHDGARFNHAQIALFVIGIVALALCVAGMWGNFELWFGARGMTSFLGQWGFSSATEDQIIRLLSSLTAPFLTTALAAIVGLLVVSAVRWQRAHAR